MSGFGITVLVVHCFVHSPNRDDISLYKTMQRIEERLNNSYEINSPIPKNDAIATAKSFRRAQKFHNCIKKSLEILKPVIIESCGKKFVRERWNELFKTDFF